MSQPIFDYIKERNCPDCGHPTEEVKTLIELTVIRLCRTCYYRKVISMDWGRHQDELKEKEPAKA